jgi:hypothetical protein
MAEQRHAIIAGAGIGGLAAAVASDRKKVMMASLDVNRPAAQEQLAILGEQTGVATLPIVAGQQPVDIAKRAMQAAKLQGYDVLILDTAGRLHVDAQLMAEMKAVADVSSPAETLLVVDSLTGQDAVNVAKNFSDQVPLTGVILTRMDGDARGGAALSMRAVTGKPIKFEVKKFTLANGRVRVGAGGAGAPLPMPPISLTDLGTKEGGITPDQLVLAVMRSVTGSIVSATAKPVAE